MSTKYIISQIFSSKKTFSFFPFSLTCKEYFNFFTKEGFSTLESSALKLFITLLNLLENREHCKLYVYKYIFDLSWDEIVILSENEWDVGILGDFNYEIIYCEDECLIVNRILLLLFGLDLYFEGKKETETVTHLKRYLTSSLYDEIYCSNDIVSDVIDPYFMTIQPVHYADRYCPDGCVFENTYLDRCSFNNFYKNVKFLEDNINKVVNNLYTSKNKYLDDGRDILPFLVERYSNSYEYFDENYHRRTKNEKLSRVRIIYNNNHEFLGDYLLYYNKYITHDIIMPYRFIDFKVIACNYICSKIKEDYFCCHKYCSNIDKTCFDNCSKIVEIIGKDYLKTIKFGVDEISDYEHMFEGDEELKIKFKKELNDFFR